MQTKVRKVEEEAFRYAEISIELGLHAEVSKGQGQSSKVESCYGAELQSARHCSRRLFCHGLATFTASFC